MAVTAAQVRELREMTGLPMMECKKALTESNGDTDGALAWLKEHASAKFSKMSSRETSQGRIATYISDDGQKAGIASLLCETAPVAGTDDFVTLANDAAQIAAQSDSPKPESVLAEKTPSNPDRTLEEAKQDVFSRIRENMNVAAVASVSGHCASYVHHNAEVGCIVAFSAECPSELATDVCMHIAAINPPYLSRDQVDADAVEAQRVEEMRNVPPGKPEEMVAKIVEGKLNRWFGEVALLEQPFVKDDKKSVSEVLKAANPELTITAFKRLQIGAS